MCGWNSQNALPVQYIYQTPNIFIICLTHANVIVSGEALQLQAVYKKGIFLSQVATIRISTASYMKTHISTIKSRKNL